jgi:predicted Zn-dependent protease
VSGATLKRFALLAGLCCAAAGAQAQFNLRNLDINKLVDTAKNAVTASSEIGEQEEIGIGRDVAARLLGAAPLMPNEGVQRYVNHVGRWLASQTERPDLPWRFGVLDAPQLNAFATPGGNVFITRGLLERMKSEAELAGVLAHEIAHVLRKHHLKAIQKGAQTALAGEALTQALARRDGANPNREKLIALGSEVFTRGLDKSDELEADRLGVAIAARGGYDAYGLASVLQTLQAMNPQDSGLALMFKTHPAPAERLDALANLQSLLDAYAAQPLLDVIFVV